MIFVSVKQMWQIEAGSIKLMLALAERAKSANNDTLSCTRD